MPLSKVMRYKYCRVIIVDHHIVREDERGQIGGVNKLVQLDESKFGKRIIQQHIAVGTEIHTDCWRAYARLTEFGYLHKVVNHSDPFIAADGTHTQRIEASWRPAKDWFRERRIPGFQFAESLVKYQWRRELKKNKDPFSQLLQAVHYYYNKNV